MNTVKISLHVVHNYLIVFDIVSSKTVQNFLVFEEKGYKIWIILSWKEGWKIYKKIHALFIVFLMHIFNENYILFIIDMSKKILSLLTWFFQIIEISARELSTEKYRSISVTSSKCIVNVMKHFNDSPKCIENVRYISVTSWKCIETVKQCWHPYDNYSRYHIILY